MSYTCRQRLSRHKRFNANGLTYLHNNLGKLHAILDLTIKSLTHKFYNVQDYVP